jgi:multiple sugar transport system ATP-binding protein
LRVQTRAEISKLHQRLGTTFVYVTHDQTEAMTMATRIAVLNLGELQQVGTPLELYDRPENLFVASFIGSPAINLFEATIRREDGGMEIESGSLRLPVSEEAAAALAPHADGQITLGIRPENIHDAALRPGDIRAHEITADVDVTEMMGNEALLYLVLDGRQVIARVDPRTRARPGERIQLAINLGRLYFFDPRSEQTIRAG